MLTILGPVLVALTTFWVETETRAEPWLGSRFAQNCAGCHSPQRLNVAPAKRRCNLSCQGCHVNPNGGGLRSFYGKWNENRWLKSFRSDLLKHDKNFAPFKTQIYGKKKWKPGIANPKLIIKRGVPLRTQATEMDEPLYDRRYGQSEIVTENEEEYYYHVPEEDPWRQMGRSKFDAGADVRWYAASKSFETNKKIDKGWTSFLMGVDVGARYRPFYRKLHFVYEGRIIGNPRDDVARETVISQAQTRSLYTMVDDLPWNSFIMAGYYRPGFGNIQADHDALGQKMQAQILTGNTRAQELRFNAVTMGTAPNVPYFNVHLIQDNFPDSEDRMSGFAISTGLRFVTYSGSVNYSYWRTTDDRINSDVGINEVEMHAMSFGGMYKRLVAMYEAIAFKSDRSKEDFREGGVHTIDTYTKLWREIYFLAAYSLGNTAVDLGKGHTSQFKGGVRSFLYPGIDFTLLYEFEKEKKNIEKVTYSRNAVSLQLHTFF